ncbi:MAG: YdcF family protein [Clostridia bacterium]|nr:YdcF family protein [Clostridia bacterium]
MAERRGVGEYIEAVTRFIFAADTPEKADIIFLPGSSHTEHVRLAAELYQQGLASLILPSGAHPKKTGRFTAAEGYASEAAWMRAQLMALGVPAEAILTEEQATFTWENALLSRRLTDSLDLQVHIALLCCRPFHARRALMYYEAAFPETRLLAIPASEPGLNADDWHLTPEGRARVLGEVRRLGSQINEVLERAINSTGGPP